MIQYRYAKTKNGEQVDIETLFEKKEKYYCIGCEREMIAHFWGEKWHHFQHKAKCTCSSETYLHKLAKMIFLDTFKECRDTKEPFYIEFSQNLQCNYYEDIFNIQCSYSIDKKINLLDFFTEVLREEREGEFIPDIILYNKKTKQKLFIEIQVTHGSSYKKIISEYRIIEIVINEENDINCIRKKYICEKPGKIMFYNFKRTLPGYCNGDCKCVYYFFCLSDYGKVSTEEKNLKQIEETINKEKRKIVKYYIAKKNYREMFNIYKKFVIECFKSGFLIKQFKYRRSI